MQEVLIIIDVQNDYFPGGTCELYHPYEAEKEIQKLISKTFLASLDGVFATIK